jgi:hypothetical protein
VQIKKLGNISGMLEFEDNPTAADTVANSALTML